MPNLERLAADGLIFERTFCLAPVCSPARSAIISGTYGPRVGAQWHRRAALAPMPAGLRMFPWYLRQAGYYTTNNVKTDYNLRDEGLWDESSSTATWRGRRSGQPFFHVQNHTTTHESSLHLSIQELAAVGLETDPDRVRIFPFHPDTPEFRRTYALYHDRHRLLDRQIGELLEKLEADGLRENTIVFYFGDNGGAVPGTKGYLRNASLQVPLVVWFPPRWRHLALAAPGSRLRGFVSFVDLAPSVLRLAGLAVPEAMDGRAFLGAGVDPAELAARDEAFGYADRFDERFDLVRSLRKGRFQYTRNYLPHYPESSQNNYRYKMVAFQQWRDLYRRGRLTPAQGAFFAPRPSEALYDLETDPFELHNLAADPAYAKVLQNLRQRLRERLKGMPDLGFLPESAFLEVGLADPVGYGRTHADELAKLVDVADLSLRPFSEVRARLEAVLRGGSVWERYWALVACAAFGREAASLAPQAQNLARTDPERLVRVRAAEFLVLASGADPVPVITAALRATRDPVEAALMLNSVVWLQDRDPRIDFGVDASWFPADWTKHAMVGPRLEFLASERSASSTPQAVRRPGQALSTEPRVPSVLRRTVPAGPAHRCGRFFLQDPLTSPGLVPGAANKRAYGGEFTSRGWRALKNGDFRMVELKQADGFEGVLKIDLHELDWVQANTGTNRDKIQFLGMFSNPRAELHVEGGGTRVDALWSLRGGTAPAESPPWAPRWR